MVDREETKFFNGPTDLLKYKITVCDTDCENEASAIISITVEDINDNNPLWTVVNPVIDVLEGSENGVNIVTYSATDLDRPGKYFFK